MIKFHSIIFCVLISLFLLTGCGFTLRSASSLPPQLHQIYYQADNDPYGPFATAFKRSLQASNIILLTAPNTTAPILHIAANYNYSTQSSNASVETRTYTLGYTATISINNASGTILLSPQTVSTSCGITLQSNEMFETTPQVEIIKQEMQQELFTKILNVLSAKKTFEALGNSSLPKHN